MVKKSPSECCEKSGERGRSGDKCVLCSEVSGGEVEGARRDRGPHGCAGATPGDGAVAVVDGSFALAARGASTLQSSDGGCKSLIRRQVVVRVELDGGDAQTRRRVATGEVCRSRTAVKPPRPGLRPSEMREPGWPITYDSNLQADLLCYRRASVTCSLLLAHTCLDSPRASTDQCCSVSNKLSCLCWKLGFAAGRHRYQDSVLPLTACLLRARGS